MYHKEGDIKNYCARCNQEFAVEISQCPTCGSNLVNYNTRLFTKIFAIQKWERLNRRFEGKKRELVANRTITK
jgi:hypothetical protein